MTSYAGAVITNGVYDHSDYTCQLTMIGHENRFVVAPGATLLSETLLTRGEAGHEEDWPEQAIYRVTGLLRLPDNWDHEGGKRISGSVVSDAISYIGMFANGHVPQPFVVPTRVGGIAFSWETPQLFVDLELLPNEDAQLHYEWATEGERFEGMLADSPRHFLRLLSAVRAQAKAQHEDDSD